MVAIPQYTRRDFIRGLAYGVGSCGLSLALKQAGFAGMGDSVFGAEALARTGQEAKTLVIDPHYHLLKKEWQPQKLWDAIASQLSVHVMGAPTKRMSAEEFRE